jgi:uncharacterized Zn-finger protein
MNDDWDVTCPECDRQLRRVDIVDEEDGTPTCIYCGFAFEYQTTEGGSKLTSTSTDHAKTADARRI